MAVNRRAMALSMAAALVISVIGGYFVSRSHDSTADDTVRLGASNTFVETQIPTNRQVRGAQLPNVKLTNLLGAEISTAELIGQPLVINVWAASCAACKRELPVFADLHQEFGDSVRFVGVNQYANDDIALEFAQSRGVKYELLADLNGEFVAALGITGLPYTLFVAPDGTIVAQKGIELDAEMLRSTLTESLLG
jgi:thiol-disulfide isomerase/thioredoxin